MSVRSEREVILEHALQDSTNLEVALKIGAAYDEIRDLVISRFVSQVADKLKACISSRWTIRINTGESDLEKYGEYLFANCEHNSQNLRIAIVANDTSYPLNPYFSVRSYEAPEGSFSHIRTKIDQKLFVGKKGKHDIWYSPLKKPYSKWGSDESTLLLYTSPVAIDYVVSTFLQLSIAVEQALTLPADSEPQPEA